MTAVPGAPAIESLSADGLEGRLGDLGGLLHACVHAGASIGFILPFSADEAARFWHRRVLPGLRDGTRVVLTARLETRIVGTVQLGTDTPPNQPHRAEVAKLLVHPDCRRAGIARALMAAVEEEARRRGRSLLTLDTRTGDAAEPLYASLGYATAGVIPGYCRDPFRDVLDSTTVMYKAI
ncbi:MAG: GNAT family N-acetyltransferase [Hyphomicrobiales bacterium]|nr:GNAT family N-acetyltransferase [Hyphomicrobiales bacterium]